MHTVKAYILPILYDHNLMYYSNKCQLFAYINSQQVVKGVVLYVSKY